MARPITFLTFFFNTFDDEITDHRVRCTDFEFSINDQSDYQAIIRDSDSFSSHFGSRGRLAVDVVARTVPI